MLSHNFYYLVRVCVHLPSKLRTTFSGDRKSTTSLISPDEIPDMGSYNLEVPNFGLCCLRGRAETRLSPSWHSLHPELQSNLSVEPNDHRPCVHRATPSMTSTPRHFPPDPKRPRRSFPVRRCRPAGKRLRLTPQWLRGQTARYFPTDRDYLCCRCARHIPTLLPWADDRSRHRASNATRQRQLRHRKKYSIPATIPHQRAL